MDQNTYFQNQKAADAWGLGQGLLVWLLSVLLVLFVPLAGSIAYLAIADPSVLTDGTLAEVAKGRSDLIVVNILFVLPAHLLTLGAAWMIVTANGKRDFLDSLGWDWGGFKWWHAAAILLGFFAVSALITQFLPEQEHELLRILRSSKTALYAVAFLATFTAPFVEEVIYRGVLYSPAEKRLGKAGAVILVTFLFSIIHVPQYLPSYSTIVLIFLLSLVLTLIRATTSNLLPCVVLHLIFNGLQSIRLVADPLLQK